MVTKYEGGVSFLNSASPSDLQKIKNKIKEGEGKG
jgi:hypothetical protein